MNTIGERIRMIRNNMSRQAFADKYGIHRNTLERWEKGQRQPDAAFLAALVMGEKITHKWLVSGEGPLHPGSASASPDGENGRRVARQEMQPAEKTHLEWEEMGDSRPFPENAAQQEEINALNKELRDLLRQNGDLRVENAELRARVRDLERELREALKPEERSAPVASAG